MPDGLTKVCPNCGNEYFYTTQQVKELVIVDGEGKQIDVVKTLNFNRDDKRLCIQCNHETDEENLVTEAFFHNDIALRTEE